MLPYIPFKVTSILSTAIFVLYLYGASQKLDVATPFFEPQLNVSKKLVGLTSIGSAGLGTSTSKEAKEYFANMAKHRIGFKYSGPEDDAAITLVTYT